jgi:TP53 regulating kinase-like protein
LLSKCRRIGVSTPTVFHVDAPSGSIFMELVDGVSLKRFIVDRNGVSPILADVVRQAAAALGRGVAALHNADIIHGDLTSSNCLVRSLPLPDGALALTFIDFGLGFSSAMAEDKAVDLYVLERALVSTHAHLEPLLFDAFLADYSANVRDSRAILAKFAQVKLRGRKKIAFG